MSSYRFSFESDFGDLNRHFETGSLDDLLRWSLTTFGDKMAQVTSFGPDGIVILDHLARLSPGVKVIAIDTNFLFPETYSLWEQVRQRYPIQLEVHQPSLTPKAQAQQYGPELWAVHPDQCCQLRKVTPLEGALQGLNAWITGLRRDQSPTRANLPLVSWDARYRLVKINPLAGWSRNQVWAYIWKHNLPYNALHDRGYPSIGCAPCTRPAVTPDDERSGRWSGQQKVECGIHLP